MVRRTRSSWTSTKPGFSASRLFNYSEMQGISVHWPGTSQKFLKASWNTIAAALRGYRNYHVGTRGWADIGYNIGITPQGDEVLLAGRDRAAAHSGSASNPRANFRWLGVLFLLGPGEKPTEAMWETFRRVRADFLKKAPQATAVRGHQQVPGTSTGCPGPNILRDINAGKGSSGSKSSTPSKPTTPSKSTSKKTTSQLAQEVIDGKHGTGEARKRSLGSRYSAVQAEVNRRLLGQSKPAPSTSARKTVSQLAQEVIDGKHGTGAARKRALGTRYNAVQAEVNRRLLGRTSGTTTKSAPRKSISQLADEVMRGVHGDGDRRKRSLGSRYSAVQAEVNRRLR